MHFKWMDRLELSEEPLPAQPLIEVCGCRRVLIEHHSGVSAYGSKLIRVRVQYGSICVTGNDLTLRRMTADQLVITGMVDCVYLERTGG